MRRRMLILSAAIAMVACGSRVTVKEPITPENDRSGGIHGVVRASDSRTPLPNALVILEGEALPQPQETMTNSRGAYWFPNLTAGDYTLEVLYGAAADSRAFTHDGSTRLQADFALDPSEQLITSWLPAGARPRPGCS